jgi:type II secretory pathway pseudopilin PulG
LTTLELMIALTITVTTGMAMTAVLTAAGGSMTRTSAERSAMQRAAVLHHRLRAYVVDALSVLQSDDRGLAIWLVDDNSNERVEMSELRVLWLDAEEQSLTLERVTWPADMTPAEIDAADTTLAGVDDPFEMMVVFRRMGFTEQSLFAHGVAGLAAVGNESQLQASQRIAFTVEMASELNERESVLLSLGLPNWRAPR